MADQLIILVTILFWVILNVLSFTSPLRRNLSKQPPLGKLRTLEIVLLETIALFLALTNGWAENIYATSFGSILLLVGWVVSNNRILVPAFHKKWLVRLNDRIFSLLGIDKDFYYLSLSGDWIQFVGLSLLLSSFYGLIFSLFLFPLITHFLTVSLMPPRSYTTDPHVIQPTSSFIWPGWKLVARIICVMGAFLFFSAFLNNELVLYNQSIDDARSLLEMLIQTEATVFALVLTFVFVLIEFTNTAYTSRLSGLVFNRISFKALVVISATSILSKVFILSNQTWLSIFFINWALFYSIVSIAIFVVFALDVFRLLQPEALVYEILKWFDSEWVNVIKEQWTSEWTPKPLYPSRDPMFVIERILVESLARSDINSFRTTLIQLRDKIKSLRGPNDGIFLDLYLSNSLQIVARKACDQHLDLALEYLCGVFIDVTKPSLDSMKNFETGIFHIPPGCSLLRQTLDFALDHQMQKTARVALYALQDRATNYLSSLPSFSELFSSNPENFGKEFDAETMNIFVKNDHRVVDYEDGFLRYFGEVGVKAVEVNMPSIASQATSYLSEQLCKIIEKIPDDKYQITLIWRLCWELDRVTKSACKKKMSGAISLGSFGHGLNKITHKNVAMMIAEEISGLVFSLSKAGLLNYSIVTDVSVASTYLARINPNCVLPILTAFGDGGLAMKKGYLENEDVPLVLTEMNRRIDQIENKGLTFNIKTKVSRAANKARKALRDSK